MRTLFFALVVIVSGCAPTGDSTVADSSFSEEVADPTSIRPFEIRVSDEVIDDLMKRLSRTRFPDQIEDSGWDYGTPLSYMRELVDYWQNGFDWRDQERKLNEFDQFKTRIGDLDIHFIHQRSPEEGAIPIVITHGWPGSIVEFAKIIKPLTDPVAYGGNSSDAFHVIAPSMPGYGFSDKPSERGFGTEQIADVNAALMERLGYESYGLQGGDWGAFVSRWHAYKYPDRVTGLHVNMILGSPPVGADPTEGVPEEELARFEERRTFFQGPETGYSAIQGTKPQTLGYGLNDSPVGQAAWVVEKFRTWCDCNGDPETIFTRDELLTNIMVYCVNQVATSSARLYYEQRRGTGSQATGRVEVPTAAAIFPKELMIPPRKWAEASYNITRWTEMPRGGHFAAMEQPDLMVDDIRAFFRDLR